MRREILPVLALLSPIPSLAITCPGTPPTPRDYSTAVIRTWFSQPENITTLGGTYGPRIWGADGIAPPANNRPYLVVRSMGDPGTAERAGQASNPVTQAIGNYTGFYPTGTVTDWQRGYYDYLGANGFQMQGTTAGIMINSYSFTHTQGVQGGGPNVDLMIAYSQPYASPWATSTSELTLQASYKVPWINNAAGQGIGYVGMAVRLLDVSIGKTISYGAALFDTRPDGVGNGTEFVDDDTYVDFVSSPIKPTSAYITKSPYSTGYLNVNTFSTYQFVRFHISRANLIRGMQCMNQEKGTNHSLNPADYRLVAASIGQEVIVTEGRNISMGSSIQDFSVFEIN